MEDTLTITLTKKEAAILMFAMGLATGGSGPMRHQIMQLTGTISRQLPESLSERPQPLPPSGGGAS
jgi:hypothetical protein